MTPAQSIAQMRDAERQLKLALDYIQAAQNLVGDACSSTCSVPDDHGGGVWGDLCKAHDRVKACWYELETDRTALKRKADELAKAQAQPTRGIVGRGPGADLARQQRGGGA